MEKGMLVSWVHRWQTKPLVILSREMRNPVQGESIKGEERMEERKPEKETEEWAQRWEDNQEHMAGPRSQERKD